MRRASRDCSVETEAACCWSSQKPGRPISCSSSAMRCFRPSGSKVITDPVELDPDLLQLLSEWLLLSLGHMAIVAGGAGRIPLRAEEAQATAGSGPAIGTHGE